MACREIILMGWKKSVILHHHDFLPVQIITHPTCFVTKAAYDDLGMSDLQYRSTADYDYMLRFWEIQESCVFTSHACVI